jgi:hypothetical protein
MAALSTIALVGTAVGAGVSAYGQTQQATTAAKVGDYNAKVQQATGEYNAQIAEQNAQQVAATSEYNAKTLENQAITAELEGRENIRRRRQEAKTYLAKQRVGFAKAGVTEEGSPLEVAAKTAALLEMDAQDVNRAAQYRARLLRSAAGEERTQGAFQAGQYRQQAGFERYYGATGAARSVMEGQAASSAYKLGAATTLLQGASSVAGGYANFKKTGVIK